MAADNESVRSVLRLLIEAATNSRSADPKQLKQLIHERATFCHSGFSTIIHGREACVNSYLQFAAKSKNLSYHIHKPVVEVWDETAFCRYHYSQEWEESRTGAKLHEKGWEVYVLSRLPRQVSSYSELGLGWLVVQRITYPDLTK